MPRVRFTGHLKRHFPDLEEMEVQGATVSAVIAAVDCVHPGLSTYLLDERGVLRQHVNVFVDGQMVRDRRTLQDTVEATDEVFIAQALSGGL